MGMWTMAMLVTASDTRIAVERTGTTFGARIDGLDLRQPLSDAAFGQVRAAWHEHGVLLISGAVLSDARLTQFSRRIGTLDTAAPQETTLSTPSEFPEVMVVSNIVVDGVALGNLGSKAAYWHTDMCYEEHPPAASLLHAHEVPAHGGDTVFIDMYDAHDRLDPGLRREIEGLSIKHDRSRTAVGDLRLGYAPVDDPSQSPGVCHPMIRLDTARGCPSLYLGRRPNAYVPGLTLADSEDLLDRLWADTLGRPSVWRQCWSVGDLVIWDNRCLMHRRDAFDPAARRLMHRTQVRAESSNR